MCKSRVIGGMPWGSVEAWMAWKHERPGSGRSVTMISYSSGYCCATSGERDSESRRR